jgi:hypothetical protein
MMRRKVIFYPLYEETIAIESVAFDGYDNDVSYTHNYTLKTPAAASWDVASLLRELADRLDMKDDVPYEVP